MREDGCIKNVFVTLSYKCPYIMWIVGWPTPPEGDGMARATSHRGNYLHFHPLVFLIIIIIIILVHNVANGCHVAT
jgi:hypothetical protein